MTPVANEIELEPLAPDTGGAPLFPSALPFLGAVNVRVEIRLGTVTMTLAQILETRAGAVLAVDRGLDQPVDVLVGEHVVARGSLVAVDDRFGVCITETAALDAAAAGPAA